MTIIFLHHGQERTLAKHPKIAHALKHGLITESAAALKPWYLRLKVGEKERTFKLAALDKKKVVTEARDFLNSMQDKPNEFAAWMASREARRGLTVGQLAAEWIKAGLPFSKTKPRRLDAADQLQRTLDRALPWWTAKPLAGITTTQHEDYVAAKRLTRVAGLGDRAADMELAALSSLCQWAILTGRITENPYAVRNRYQDPAAVQHCHLFAPRSDDDFHRVLAWLWRDPTDTATVIAGAWLCFTGLVGLRPEEPAALLRVPRLDKMPPDTKSLPYGTVFPLRDSGLRMRVWRNKRGQNPFVTLHPAALQFLNLWGAWLDIHFQPSAFSLQPSPWFPGIAAADTSALNRRLTAACAELKLSELKPKGFGRAYYVRCRRSAGIEDAQIAMELGQTTNGKLIRTTYGDPDDLFASGLFDWLPENGQPAWNHLRQIPGLTGGHVQTNGLRPFYGGCISHGRL